jgi:aspartate racemase
MKTIGLIGGMSWESTALYYKQINEGVRDRLGGLHSAKIAMVSIDFEPMERLQRENRWEEAGEELAKAARQVEAAGADFIVLCTNTMHKVARAIEAAVDIPLLHIADATAQAIRDAGLHTVGLLGTRFTMQEDFYKGRLEYKYGLKVLVPSDEEMTVVHEIIYGELVRGIVRVESRKKYLEIIEGLRERGAQGVIEGCTEIVMLVQQEHTVVPLFDTTAIHARAAVEMELKD